MSRARRAGALAAALMLSACSNPPYPRGTLEELYPTPPRPELQDVMVDGHRLHYAVAHGRSGGAPVVFVHGSPGDWKAWARYLDDPGLAGFGDRIAFDRPGYGGSAAVGVMPDLRAQAALLAAAVARIEPGKTALLVGHSLGGPIIAWMLLDQPRQFCGAVSLAGSLSAAREAPRWYNRFASSAAGRWLLPREMLESNREILDLAPELTRLDAAWAGLRRPLVLLQGMKDELVEPVTADDMQARVPAQWLTVQRLPDIGHFIPWQKQPAVVAALRALPCESPP